MSTNRTSAALTNDLLNVITGNISINEKLAAIKNLIKQGANINGSGNSSRLPPLSLAIKCRKHQIVKLLLSEGVIVKDEHWQLAIDTGEIEMVQLLLKSGAIPKKIERREKSFVSTMFSFSTVAPYSDQQIKSKLIEILINISAYLSTEEGKNDEAAIAFKKTFDGIATEESLQEHKKNLQKEPLGAIYKDWLMCKSKLPQKFQILRAKNLILNMIKENNFCSSSLREFKQEALQRVAKQMGRNLTPGEKTIFEKLIDNSKVLKAKFSLVVFGEGNNNSNYSCLPPEIHTLIGNKIIEEFEGDERAKNRLVSTLFNTGKTFEKQKAEAVISLINKANAIEDHIYGRIFSYNDINIVQELCEAVAKMGWPTRRVQAKINSARERTYEFKLTLSELKILNELTSSCEKTDDRPSCSY